MDWKEQEEVPTACRKCWKEECDNCDHAGERWVLSERDDLLVRRKMLLRQIDRLHRRLEEIEKALKTIDGNEGQADCAGNSIR